MRLIIEKRLLAATLIVVIATIMVLNMKVKAEPEGASVTLVANSSKNTTAPGSSTDAKGTITTLILTTVQQNIRWKAYVGNVSGTLVLRDADEYSIYEWPTGGSPEGEVYITRNSTVDWDTIQCANETPITQEQTTLGHSSTASDNINKTFAERIHEQFVVGTTTITNSTCKALVTWINNTAQTQTQNASFQEILLMDQNSRIIYAAIIDQNTRGYRNATTNASANSNSTYDFQAIVPDYTSASVATYYFYVEITG